MPAYLPGWPNDPKLRNVRRQLVQRSLDQLAHPLPVIGMDKLLERGKPAVELTALDPVEFINLVRPRDPVVDDIPIPCAHASGPDREVQAFLALAKRLLHGSRQLLGRRSRTLLFRKTLSTTFPSRRLWGPGTGHGLQSNSHRASR